MTDNKARTSVEYHHYRGAGWDIIDEALETYDQWMLDDDYEFHKILQTIMNRMRERRNLYRPSR